MSESLKLTSVRVIKKIWKDFTVACKERGDRVWDILEPAIKAYLKKKPKK